MTMKIQHYTICGMQKSSSEREVHSDIGLPQETRKISNTKPNLPPKRIRKRRINNSLLNNEVITEEIKGEIKKNT